MSFHNRALQLSEKTLSSHKIDTKLNHIIMKASELVKKLQDEIAAKGDKEIVIAANKHSYKDTILVTKDEVTTLALFDKIPD